MCWNLAGRDLRRFESTESGSEVNLLIDGVCGERLPTIDFPHVDLPRGEQRPEQHRSSIGRRQHVWVLIRRLNSSCRRSIAFVVLALRHWLRGRGGEGEGGSPAFSPPGPTGGRRG